MKESIRSAIITMAMVLAVVSPFIMEKTIIGGMAVLFVGLVMMAKVVNPNSTNTEGEKND
ncbi:MAG: hypothetical protein PHP03_03640 [Candidatus Pacebacteria bacterium]|nr:hypothetical protein [Candidatus Paceibacterota bacterium]